MREAIQLHCEVTGDYPKGWYTGRCSSNTVEMATQIGDFAYVSDSYADDLPYWYDAGDKQQLIIPYTLDTNDMRFAAFQGFNSGDQFFCYLKDAFDSLYAEGAAGEPKMLNIGLHCRLVGRPGRIASLKRFIDYVKSHDDVWIAKRIEIAEHWIKEHPFERMTDRPSTLTKPQFVEKFGGIFEHSPWIAERAYEREMGPAHDSAIGVHSLLTAEFRKASDEERLGVLRAHPDLAGKLAAAKRLTAESTEEQASAGLDALTDDEREKFTSLNEAYTQKHGFPFIIAVKDHTKIANHCPI